MLFRGIIVSKLIDRQVVFTLKKLFSMILLCVLSLSVSVFTSFAQTTATPKMYKLIDIRKLALQNAETLDTFQKLRTKYQNELQQEESRLGDKSIDYDDNGKEITKYPYDRQLNYDYPAKIEDFDKKIKQLKKQNELAAIRKYSEILSKEIEIQKKDNEWTLSKNDLLIADKRFRAGHILAPDYEYQKAIVDSLTAEKKHLLVQLNALYEDLNRLIGLPKEARYELDKKELLTKTKVDDFTLSVPGDALAYVRKDSTLLKEMNKHLSEKKKQLELFAKTHPQGSKAYEQLEKEVDIYGLEKEVEKMNRSLYFELENDYLDILLSLIRVSDQQEAIQFDLYENALNKVKYENGLISKQIFLRENNALLDRQNDLLTQILQTYEQILRYEIKTGTALAE